MNEDLILTAIGGAVHKARTDQSLSQEKLAELSGLDRTYISSVERGQRNISILNIVKIAEALSVAPSSLILCMEGCYE